MTVEQACSVCGKPEGRRYKPPKDAEYVCSACVQRSVNMLQDYAGQLGRNKKPAHQFDHVDFKRGYIRALFLEDERWTTALTKYSMIVPGNPKSQTVIARDIALKNELSDQVHPDTYQERKAYFKAWLNAKCCADDCDKYCDECHGIKFAPVPHRLSRVFDPDVRRFMEKYQRFWLKSEQEKTFAHMRGENDDTREVFDRKNHDDTLRVRGGKSPEGFGLPGEQAEITSNPFEGQEEMFLRPGRGTMAAF
jgi:hypothetical protein